MICKVLLNTIIIVTLIFFLTSGCARFNQDVYDKSFNTLKQSAQSYIEKENYPQAYILSRSLLNAEPGNAEAISVLDKALKADPQLLALQKKKFLGSNMTYRVHNKNFGWPGKILLYIPNRILDFIDFFTVEAGLGIGAGVSVFATEYAALGLQGSWWQAMTGLNRRHLSARVTVENFLEFFPFDIHSFKEKRAFTGGVYSTFDVYSGLKRPQDNIYYQARDFWAVGVQAISLASVRVAIHPIEVADFFAGLLFFDILNDDIGVSKGFKLYGYEKKALADLSRQVSARRKIQ